MNFWLDCYQGFLNVRIVVLLFVSSVIVYSFSFVVVFNICTMAVSSAENRFCFVFVAKVMNSVLCLSFRF